MTDFAVSKEKNLWLLRKMEELGVVEADFEENFIRAPKKGGQKVNKTSSCVYLKHKPTGLEVKCMEGRSQSMNRFLARRRLMEKVEENAGGVTKKMKKAQKAKKQKAKRASRSKAKYAVGADAGETEQDG